jgi:hypothetical protein
MPERRNWILCLLVVFLLLLSGVFASAKSTSSSDDKERGVSRHPDIARDSESRLHMVWQEPLGGQYDIFYCYQSENKEIGRGSDKNPVFHITETPIDEIRPHIAIDPETDIVYIFWTEYIEAGDFDSMEGPETEFAATIFYTASGHLTDENEEMLWTEPSGFADEGSGVVDIKVKNSVYILKTQGPTPTTHTGIIDSDGDGIRDSDEVLGKNGFKTEWNNPDTDIDGLCDLIETKLGFDPLIDERETQRAQEFFEAYFRRSDLDGDGLSYTEETTGGFPVDMGVAHVHDDANFGYDFYPRDDYSAYVHLVVELTRGPPITLPLESADYRLEGSLYSPANLIRFDFTGTAMENDRFEIVLGPFDVLLNERASINFLNVEIEQPSSSTRDPDTDLPPEKQKRYMILYSVMLAAGPSNYDLFEYTEGIDYKGYPLENVQGAFMSTVISPDPWRKDLFIEVDFMEGHETTKGLFFETVKAFSDAGIILHYKLDEFDIPMDEPTSPDPHGDGAESLKAYDEMRNFLHNHRNTLYPKYIHVIFAHGMYKEDGGGVLGGAISAATVTEKSHSGVIIADYGMDEHDSTTNPMLKIRLKVLIHEIGHALGASHDHDAARGGAYHPLVDGSAGIDILNDYNVMRQGGLSGSSARATVHGGGNYDRNLGAHYWGGHSRFSLE